MDELALEQLDTVKNILGENEDIFTTPEGDKRRGSILNCFSNQQRSNTRRKTIKDNLKVFVLPIELTFENLVKVLQRPEKLRSLQEINLLLNYYDTTDIKTCLKKEYFDETNIKNFINSLISLGEYKKENQYKLIINGDDFVKDFFFLIKGKLKIYKENLVLFRMTYNKFYIRLLNFEKKGEVTAIKLNINHNKHIIRIQFADLERINYLLFLEELKYNLYKCRVKTKDITNIFSEYLIKMSQFKLDKNELEKLEKEEKFEELSNYCKSIFDPIFNNEETLKDKKKFKIGNKKNNFILSNTVEEGFVELNTFMNEYYFKERFQKEIKNEVAAISNENSEEEDDIIMEENNQKKLQKISKNRIKFEEKEEDKDKDKDKDKENNQKKTLKISDIKNKLNKEIDKSILVKSNFTQINIDGNSNKNPLEKEKEKEMIIKPREKKSTRSVNNKSDELHYCKSNITLICDTECEFIRIKAKEFNNVMSLEKQKITNKEINYLCDNFYFPSINKKYFEKKYHSKFVLKNYLRDEVLFKENDPVDKLYFIKEGFVEISFKKNIFQLTDLVKDLIKNEPEIKNSLNINIDIKLNTQMKYIVDDISTVRKMTLLKFGSKDMIGMEPFYLGIYHFYKATITSRHALIYELDIANTKSLKRESEYSDSLFNNISREKLNSFVSRAINLKNIFLRNIDEKFSNEQNQIKMTNLNSKKGGKFSKVENDNQLNIISKEVIDPEKYKQIKEIMLNKSEGVKSLIRRKPKVNKDYENESETIEGLKSLKSLKSDESKISFETKKENQKTSKNEKSEKSEKNTKKTVVLNKKKLNELNEMINSPKILSENNKKSIRNEISIDNIIELTQENSPTIDTNDFTEERINQSEREYIKFDNQNVLNIDKAFNFQIKSRDNSPVNSPKKITDEQKIKKILQKKISLEISFEKESNFSLKDPNKKSKSIRNNPLRKIDFNMQTMYESDKESYMENSNEKFSKKPKKKGNINSENNLDLKKFYNNYKSVRKASINFKLDEFFREGIPTSTKVFENGSFFSTNKNDEEKIKWKLNSKKLQKVNDEKDRKYFEKFTDENNYSPTNNEVQLTNLHFTAPDEDCGYVYKKSIFRNEELPLIKRSKYGNEHRRNVENFILSKNKHLKIIDEKILPIFTSVESKVSISCFKNPDFLGTNNDYLLPKHSMKSLNIRKFYEEYKERSVKGGKKKINFSFRD